MQTRPLVIALFASVALNLFVVGAVVGGLVIGHRVQMTVTHQPPRGGQQLWEAGRSLPPESRQAYQQVLQDEASAARLTLKASRDARRAAWGKLAADPVDIEAVRKDLATARSLELAGRASIEDHLVLFAASLPLAERSRLAAHLSRPGRGGQRGGPPGEGGGPMAGPPPGPGPE